MVSPNWHTMYVIAAKRADGQIPKLTKSIGISHDCEGADANLFFDTFEDAEKYKNYLNTKYNSCIYEVFEWLACPLIDEFDEGTVTDEVSYFNPDVTDGESKSIFSSIKSRLEKYFKGFNKG